MHAMYRIFWERILYFFFQLETSVRKQKIDQALVSMMVNDLVLPSMIEDNGFKEFVSVPDPR